MPLSSAAREKLRRSTTSQKIFRDLVCMEVEIETTAAMRIVRSANRGLDGVRKSRHGRSYALTVVSAAQPRPTDV
jgi:hypothetical protein